jgi:hypothetical protein
MAESIACLLTPDENAVVLAMRAGIEAEANRMAQDLNEFLILIAPAFEIPEPDVAIVYELIDLTDDEQDVPDLMGKTFSYLFLGVLN